MKIRIYITFLTILSFLVSHADDVIENHDWLKIYYEEEGVKRILANPLSEIDSVYFEQQEGVTHLRVAAMNSKPQGLPIDSVSRMVLGGNIPTIYIDTEPWVSEVPDKENYLTARFRYVPYGDETDTVENTVSIKGRGNTTWNMPKKPYRLKFDKKQSIAGLPKAKSFVLIANYLDNTLMKNAVAFKIGELLGLPFTNTAVPVNVVFNGENRGSYMLTNKVGINSGSVDIDENEGILWELDSNYDEEFKYLTSPYSLFCMVKDPDFHEIYGDDSEKIEEIWEGWQEDFNHALAEVRAGRWSEAFDAEQMVKYILANNLVVNCELYYPKSFFIYKEKKEKKYKAGPLWDFDWSLGFNTPVNINLLWEHYQGRQFLVSIIKTEEFQNMFAEELENFCKNRLEPLMEFIDEYAELIKDSAMADAMLWPDNTFHNWGLQEINKSRFEENVEKMKEFILQRIEVIKESDNFALF